MKSDLWRTVRRGRAGPCVLAFDFGPGRAGAGFADIVELLPDVLPVFEAVPPNDLNSVDRRSSVESRMELLIDEITANGPEVAAVVGYCAGAAPALWASVILGAAGRLAPHVVLVEPETVDRLTFVQAYETAMSSLRTVDCGLTDELSLPTDWTEDADDPVGDARLLLEAYRTAVTASFARMKLPAKFGAQLSARFHRYLSYLVMSALTPTVPLAGVEIFASSGYVRAPLFPGELRRLHVHRDRLLAHPAVATAIRRAVATHESVRQGFPDSRGAIDVQR